MFIIIAVACTQKKQPVIIPGEDITALRKQIAAREQKINDTALAKHTAILLELYKQQADDSRKVGDWDQFARYYAKRYELAAADSSHSFLVSCLDSIITYEDTLAKTAAWRGRLADAYFNRAYEFDQAERYAAEVADCEKYFQYAGDSAGAEYLQYIYSNAANAWTRIGDQQQAIIYHEKALYWAKKINDPEELAIKYISLVNGYQVFQQNSKAIDIAQAALLLQGVSLKRKAYLNGLLAGSYNSEQQNNEALKYIDIGLSLIGQYTALTGADSLDKYERTATLYQVKSDILSGGAQFEQAKYYCRQALEYRSLVDPELREREAGKSFIALGRLYVRSGQTDSALYCYDRTLKALFPGKKIGLDNLPAEKDLLHENTIMEALDAASDAYEDKYRQTLDASYLQRSLNCINLAFKTEELIRQLYIYDNSKYNQGNESRTRSQHGIEISMLLSGATGNDKWLDEAFMYAEKSRANVLMDKIKENLLSGLSNDSSFAETKQLWFKIQSISDEINRLKQDTANAAKVQALTKEKEQFNAGFSRNRNRANTLLQNVYKNNSIYTTTTGIRQKLLHDNDAIIEYFAGDSLLYRFVLQKGKENVEMAAVPLNAADTLIRALLPYLTDKDKYNNNPAAFAQLAASLYRQIFPVLPASAKKVMIIADGLLQFIPFEALMADAGKPDFLVQQFQFTSAFSCASLLQQMNMAGGVFDADGIAFAPFTSKGKDSLPALPQSGAEAESLRNGGDVVTIFKNEQATSKRFMEQAGKGKILHLASHAFADGSDSIQPRIEFADGSLSLEKIYALQLTNRLVVLSACQTGIGKLVTAEGALSLARGFYYSGAKNVINSLWEVDDQSAGQIFGKFYRHLKKTGSINQSLALARQEYIKEAPVEKRSPYYWASFVCIGDGVYEEPKDNTRFILICVGGLLGLTALMIVFRRKKQIPVTV